MKLSIALAILPVIGSAYAAPSSPNSVLQRDGKDAGKPEVKPVYKPDPKEDKDYDWTKDKCHYPDNLWCYPNKYCDVRYQNFLDLLLDDVCAKFYECDLNHKDKEWDDGKKYKRDGEDYKGGDGKKGEHKEPKKCNDKADKLLDATCRAYYHYKPKDDGKKDDHKKDDYKKDDGKKDDDKKW